MADHNSIGSLDPKMLENVRAQMRRLDGKPAFSEGRTDRDSPLMQRIEERSRSLQARRLAAQARFSQATRGQTTSHDFKAAPTTPGMERGKNKEIGG